MTATSKNCCNARVDFGWYS